MLLSVLLINLYNLANELFKYLLLFDDKIYLSITFLFNRIVKFLYGNKEVNFALLCDADPHLLLTFIYICPKKEYVHLFERIPPYLSLLWLRHSLTHLDKRIHAQNVSFVIN